MELGDKKSWNFGNLGVGDSAPVTLGQLAALMAVTVMKVFCKNLLVIMNLSASKINFADAGLGYCQEVEKLLSDGTAFSSIQPMFVELHDLQVCIS